MALDIVFMGTPDFAAAALGRLIDAGHRVVCVYSQPPRPAGRGKKDRRSPVHELAEREGIEVRTPATLRDPAAQASFAALEADVAVVAAYGLILPKPILDAPRLGCVNIHASLLPRWRGAAPIQRAIMAGDRQTGITIMKMDEGLDTGPMILTRTLAIAPDATAGSLHDDLAALGAEAVVEALAKIEAGTATETPQPDDGATYAPKIDKAEARIDWTRPAAEVARHIHGLSPFPSAFFELDGQRVKVLAAALSDGSGEPGTVLDDALTVACGEGAVRLIRLQRQGKGAMDAPAFLRGFSVPKGARLG